MVQMYILYIQYEEVIEDSPLMTSPAMMLPAFSFSEPLCTHVPLEIN